MQTLRVNGYDMAYLEVGHGPPLVCVHGTLGDFRTWSSVMGPLSKAHHVIAVSLRHFFPEHWDGVGDDYLMSQHVSDTIAFIAQIGPTPVDLMGHSRGGHVAFRVAQQRPDLLRKLVLLELTERGIEEFRMPLPGGIPGQRRQGRVGGWRHAGQKTSGVVGGDGFGGAAKPGRSEEDGRSQRRYFQGLAHL